jgi:integrase
LIVKQLHLASRVELPVNNPPAHLFDQFLQERQYLKNVTDATLVWYRVAFRNWQALHPASDPPPLPTKATFQQFVIALRDPGIRPVTCNTYIGAMNAFCRWLSEEGHVRERVKLGKLRVERRLLTLLDEVQMRALIGFKPKTFRQARVHLATLLILDTGLRISEALHLLVSDIDFDNLVLKVFGKGQKERLVPFSPELRRRIYRYQQLRAKKQIAGEFLFTGFEGTPVGEAEQHRLAVSAAGQAGSAPVWLAPAAAHVCHELPPTRWGHRAFVNGARAYADHNDSTLSAPRGRRHLHLAGGRLAGGIIPFMRRYSTIWP